MVGGDKARRHDVTIVTEGDFTRKASLLPTSIDVHMAVKACMTAVAKYNVCQNAAT